MAQSEDSKGEFINDGQGTSTDTAGTAFTRVVPPSKGVRASLTDAVYLAGTTAHTLTGMNAFQEVLAPAATAIGATAIILNDLPESTDAWFPASGDYLCIEHADGSYGAYLVSGAPTGFSVPIGALAKNVNADARVFFMGAPADHAIRQYYCPASTLFSIPTVVVVGTANDQPVMAHSDNATAQGRLLCSQATYFNVQ